MKLKTSVVTIALDVESRSFSYSANLLKAAAAAQKEKKILDDDDDEDSEDENSELNNTQLTSSKTNDSFDDLKTINLKIKNLNIAAMKEKIIVKLKKSNKSLVKQLLIKMQLSSQIKARVVSKKRKVMKSSDSSLEQSFIVISREEGLTTHTREQRKLRISRNSTIERDPDVCKRRKVSDSSNSEKRQVSKKINNNNRKVNKVVNNNNNNNINSKKISFERFDKFFASKKL